MEQQPLELALTATTTDTRFFSELAARFPLGEAARAEVTAFYLDSFDWRLLRTGRCLCLERGQGGQQLIYLSLEGHQPPLALPWAAPEPPRFPAELPEGPLRHALQPLLGLRALLPRVELRIAQGTAPLLDGEAKTRARVRLQHSTLVVPGKAPVALTDHVALLPVRGYGESLAELREWLTEALGLAPIATPLLHEALERLGQGPGDYNPKLDLQFDPQQPAREVMRTVHLHLLQAIEANLQGVKADLDSEFLHDLRVAVRRTRSLLTQVKGVFAEEATARFKERLAWLGNITGLTRDMDVYLLKFDDYRQSLPAAFQPHLDPLHDFLLAHKAGAHQALVRQLSGPEFLQLLREWRGFLGEPGGDGPTAKTPVTALAGRRIWRMFRRVRDQGEALRADSSPEALHELRKSCKKLRYLMECFHSLYPKEEVQSSIKAVKLLQEHLGDYQDLAVQAEKLREFARQMTAEGRVPADTLLAMGMLVDGLLRQQQALRQRLAPRVAEFVARPNARRFRALFHPKKRGDDADPGPV